MKVNANIWAFYLKINANIWAFDLKMLTSHRY